MTWASVIAPARLLPPEEAALAETLSASRLLLGSTFVGSPEMLPVPLLESVSLAVSGAGRSAIRRPGEARRTSLLSEWREHSFARPAGSVAPPALSRLVFLGSLVATLPLVPLPMPDEGGRVSGLPLPAFRGRAHSVEDPGRASSSAAPSSVAGRSP